MMPRSVELKPVLSVRSGLKRPVSMCIASVLPVTFGMPSGLPVSHCGWPRLPASEPLLLAASPSLVVGL